MKVLRIRSPQGQFRIEYSAQTSLEELRKQIDSLLKTNNSKIYYDQGYEKELLFNDKSVSSLQLSNGQIFYSSDKQSNNLAKPLVKRNYIKQDPLDDLLLKEKGLIKRGRNAMYCRHAENAMCEYCLPLEPYDQGYLDEKKIKHMSFHGYLRKLVDGGRLGNPFDEKFIAPLDDPSFTVMIPCPGGTHSPYPDGICSKCQPSAITLQVQNFRMVDHVEFETPSLIEDFIGFWRGTGMQRVGFLMGKYDVYDEVPLGVKAIVSAIYEPPQHNAHDMIDMNPDPNEELLSRLTNELGLAKIGIIYTDLIDDGTGRGKVVCRRHQDSYFMSSSEILFSAHLQSQHPVKSLYSSTGQFGSRFMTVIITGNEQGDIDIQSYQVSNTAVAMTRDSIIEASTNPGLMRVCQSTSTKYVPDVFFKYKNEYKIMVQEAAKPTFPVEYLLITSSHGFPQNPSPKFERSTIFKENRIGIVGSDRSVSGLKRALREKVWIEVMSDFHCLLFLLEMGLIDSDSFNLILKAVETRSQRDIDAALDCGGWKTVRVILDEAEISSASAGPSTGAARNNTPWSCRHCTFHNLSGENCEMCGLPRD